MPQFLMPAEWEPHARTWLAWPHNKADWPDKFAPIPYVFAEMVRLIALSERVGLIVKDARTQDVAKDILTRANVKLNQVDFVIHPTNRGWLRDCGPIFVKDAKGKKHAARFQFNAWAKYPNWKKDNTVAERVAKYVKAPVITAQHKGRKVVLEGGSIDVNGKGTLLTTEECLLSKIQCRNPKFTRDDYESVFEKTLGITNTIWLGDGIVGDDTHGHVDDLARFVNATTIVTVREKNKKDKNHAKLEDNFKRLQKARSETGKPFNIVSLPMPAPVIYEGEVLPASYANFLITNGHVLVPVFNDAADREALNILAECFPSREVIGIYARDLVWGLGTIHCLTQQEPK